MATQTLKQVNPNLAFQFLGVEDCGPSDCGRGSGCCPHCGAEGRYIYHWAEYGVHKAAMAGCYKALTGHVDKDAESKFFEVLSRKQASNKPLNGWQRTVIRMMEFIQQGKYDEGWCRQKIREAIADQQRFAFSKGR